MDTSKTREVSCYNCGIKCRRVYPRPDGKYTLAKCATIISFMISSKIIDCNFTIACHNLCEEYGLDATSTGNCIAFAIELYQKGILTKEDTDGMHLEFGNKELFYSLIKKIAWREGLGDVLANGVYHAARQIGRGAEEYVHHTKKLEPFPSAVYSPYNALCQAISDRGDTTRGKGFPSQFVWPRPREEREAYIKSGFFHYPKEFEKYILADYDFSGADYEGVCQLAAYDEEMSTLADATGLCYYWVGFMPYPPISNRPLTADLISGVTGMDIDETEATKIAKRIISLVRASNVRAGLRRKDDKPAEVYFQKPARPPLQTVDRGRFEKWIDRFYEIRGWNSEGIPTKETLEELGLDYVRQDLEQREILTG